MDKLANLDLGQMTRDIFVLLTRKQIFNPAYKSFQTKLRQAVGLYKLILLLKGQTVP